MPTTLNRTAYERLIREDVEWLLRQPHALERDHIEQVLRDSPSRLYEKVPAMCDDLIRRRE